MPRDIEAKIYPNIVKYIDGVLHWIDKGLMVRGCPRDDGGAELRFFRSQLQEARDVLCPPYKDKATEDLARKLGTTLREKNESLQSKLDEAVGTLEAVRDGDTWNGNSLKALARATLAKLKGEG